MIQLQIARSIFHLGENSNSSGDKEVCLYEGTLHLMKAKSSGLLDEILSQNITEEIQRNIEKCPRIMEKLTKHAGDVKETPTTDKGPNNVVYISSLDPL